MRRRRPTSGFRAIAVYSVARLLVLVAVAAALYLAGLRGALLVFVAVLGSGLVSLVLLAPQRAAMATALNRGKGRRPGRGLSGRIAASASAEDAYVDSITDPQPGGTGTNPAGGHQED